MYLFIAIVAYLLIGFYGFKVYSKSRESDDSKLKKSKDNQAKSSKTEDNSNDDTETKEFEQASENNEDKLSPREGKKALFATFVAILVAISLSLLINSLWSLSGVPASDVAYAVVTGIAIYTFAYIYSIDNSGDKPWHKVFTIYVIVVLVIIAIAWLSNRESDTVAESGSETTTSTTNESPGDRTEDTTSLDCEPTTIMDELRGATPCYRPPGE